MRSLQRHLKKQQLTGFISMKNKYLFILIALIVIVLDQLTKYLVKALNIPYIKNTGAGFGILQGQTLMLIFASIFAVGIILYYHDKAFKSRLTTVAASLILGGTLSNLIDRIYYRHVIDFINLKIWPSFNIADTAISIGALLLVYYFWKK